LQRCCWRCSWSTLRGLRFVSLISPPSMVVLVESSQECDHTSAIVCAESDRLQLRRTVAQLVHTREVRRSEVVCKDILQRRRPSGMEVRIRMTQIANSRGLETCNSPRQQVFRGTRRCRGRSAQYRYERPLFYPGAIADITAAPALSAGGTAWLEDRLAQKKQHR
jgi:hypothetical protein